MALVLACVVLVAGQQAPAQAQVVADPDFWKGTTERADTVYRFVYRQSPQAIPSGYDPVLEAEEILRQRQALLSPSNPQAPSLWQQVRAVTVRTGLSTPLRALGTINLVAGSAYVGWQIGSGINAKFLKLGVPPATEGPDYYRWDRITWMPANSREYYGAFYPAQDGWVIGLKQTCCNYSEVDRWFEAPCLFSGFVPPDPFVTQGPRPSTGTCWTPQGSVPSGVLWGWAPENALGAPEPIQDYTNQPYSYWRPAPTPPPQTTVEDSIDNELEQPENHLLRQWLNYQLGSPGEGDPLSDLVNVPQPTAAPGGSGETFLEALDALGLTNVKVKVLSNPEFDPAFDEGSVVRVSPPPGTSVGPGEEIVVTVNRTAHRSNDGECDRSTRQDPGSPPSGDEFSLKDMFSGRNPDQGMASTDVPFRWGTPGWGYRHVEIGHGWDNDRDRVDTQAALYDPEPEPDLPGSHRFYFFYLGPNRIPCTRRVVARFDVGDGEPAKRGIITSFAHPGWFRRSDFAS